MKNNDERLLDLWGDGKADIIRKIIDYHPGYNAGTRRQFSLYVGGMKDTGYWDLWKMHDSTIEDLQRCLYELEKESKPPPPLSSEDQIKANTIICLPNGIITNELEEEKWAELHERLENSLLWGSHR